MILKTFSQFIICTAVKYSENFTQILKATPNTAKTSNEHKLAAGFLLKSF